VPAKSKERYLNPSGVFPYALDACFWEDVESFLLKAEAEGRITSLMTCPGSDRISWKRPYGEVMYRKVCGCCGRATADKIETGTRRNCRPCQMEYDRAMQRAYTALWRIRKYGESGIPSRVFTKECNHCGSVFQPKRSTAQFCSTKCRVAAHRKAAS
jgi:hypothetical protein